MEEDLEILKELANDMELGFGGWFKRLSEKERKALEHIIKGYKELEYKYDKALSDLVQAEHKNKELEEENRILKRANSIAEDISIEDITQVMNKAYKDFIKEFIPTSLVKEKIEDLEKRGYFEGADAMKDLLERSGEDETKRYI